jgi:hypothetical protein
MAGVPQQGIAAPVDVPAATPLPMRSPSSFGADVGAGLEQLGGQLQQDQVRAKTLGAKRQYEVDASAAGVAAANATLGASEDIDRIREEAAPGAAGHVEAVTKAVDDRFGEVLSSIQNPALRSQFAEDLARTRARLIGDESGWAAGQKVAYQVTNVKETSQTLGNAVLQRPDDGTFNDSLRMLATTIGNQGLSADKSEQLFRDQAQSVAEARAKGLILGDPAQGSGPEKALDWLGGDQAATYLPADKRAELISEAETALRVQAADQRRQTALTTEQWRAAVTAATTDVSRGVLLPDDQLQGLIQRGQSLQASDPTGQVRNTLDQLQYDEGKLKLSRVTDKWTSAEWDHAINPLAAKVAQGKASEDEQRTLKIYQELRPAKQAQIANDPDSKSSATGIVPPQVDLTAPDPGTVQARKSWAEGFARTYRLVEPPYLNKDQLADYRQRVGQGPVAQFEAAQEIKATWGDAAPSIVRQIGGAAAPDMKIMLGLNPAIAQRFSRGQDALDKKAVELDDNVARQVFGTYARGLPSDLQTAVFDAARKIAAGWMLEKGFTKAPANFPQVFQAALQYAAGRGGDVNDFNSPGGLAELNGRYAWLPADMSSNDFLRRVARAQPQDWVNAATDAHGNPVKSVPHYIGPDGKPKPYKVGDALRFSKGTLQTLDTGLYHLVDPLGHTVVDERGKPWTFDVRRLPR